MTNFITLNVLYAVAENIIANVLCDVFKHLWKILVIPAFWLLLRWLRRVGIRKILHLVQLVLKKAKELLTRIRGHDAAGQPEPKPPNKHERGKNSRSPPRRKKRRKRKMRERKHRK